MLWVVVAIFAVVALSSIVGAYLRYRAVMRRKWPDVKPLPDDDE